MSYNPYGAYDAFGNYVPVQNRYQNSNSYSNLDNGFSDNAFTQGTQVPQTTLQEYGINSYSLPELQTNPIKQYQTPTTANLNAIPSIGAKPQQPAFNFGSAMQNLQSGLNIAGGAYGLYNAYQGNKRADQQMSMLREQQDIYRQNVADNRAFRADVKSAFV